MKQTLLATVLLLLSPLLAWSADSKKADNVKPFQYEFDYLVAHHMQWGTDFFLKDLYISCTMTVTIVEPQDIRRCLAVVGKLVETHEVIVNKTLGIELMTHLKLYEKAEAARESSHNHARFYNKLQNLLLERHPDLRGASPRKNKRLYI